MFGIVSADTPVLYRASPTPVSNTRELQTQLDRLEGKQFTVIERNGQLTLFYKTAADGDAGQQIKYYPVRQQGSDRVGTGALELTDHVGVIYVLRFRGAGEEIRWIGSNRLVDAPRFDGIEAEHPDPVTAPEFDILERVQDDMYDYHNTVTGDV
ncbi:MAG: hypothetical protein ACKVOH_00145 [Chlamydiales bacterium]